MSRWNAFGTYLLSLLVSVACGGRATLDQVATNSSVPAQPTADAGICQSSGECPCDGAFQWGLDPNAAWPIGGGCSTRRGLSRFAGVKAPNLAWSRALGGTRLDYSSGLALGAGHAVYATASESGIPGFAKLTDDGNTEQWFSYSLGAVPVLGSGDVRYTVARSLEAHHDDGSSIWSDHRLLTPEGEPAVGADGTIYVAGGTPTGNIGLVAFTPTGEVAWHVDTGMDNTIPTWPAVSPDGTVYLGGADADDGTAHSLFAVSQTGELRWKVGFGPMSAPTYPAVGPDGNVFVGNGRTLWSFTPNGDVRFHFVDEDTNLSFEFLHIAMGPTGIIYAAYDYSGDGSSSGIRAFTADGVPEWTLPISHSTPGFPVVDRDGTVFLGIGDQLVSVSAAGSMIWSFRTPDQGTCASIVVDSDGTLYATCGEVLYAFR